MEETRVGTTTHMFSRLSMRFQHSASNPNTASCVVFVGFATQLLLCKLGIGSTPDLSYIADLKFP